MAEEANPIDADRGSQDADRIKQEIERTRANMSGTIDEIQERLNPTNMMQQAKDSVRGATVGKVKDALNTASQAAGRAAEQAQATASRVAGQAQVTASRVASQAQVTASRVASRAQSTARRAASQTRENPVPAALIASSALWLMSRGLAARGERYATRQDHNRWSHRSNRSADGQFEDSAFMGRSSGLMGNRTAQGAFVAGALGYYLISRRMASTRDGESLEYGATGMTGTSTTDRVRRALAQPARSVGESARRVGETAKRAGRTAQQKAVRYAGRGKDVGQQVTEWMGEHPLAVGAAALALGTVVGLSMMNDDFMYDDEDDWSAMSRRSNDVTGHGDDDFGRGAETDLDRGSPDLGPKPGRSGRSSRM
jgi:hypothetical protein